MQKLIESESKQAGRALPIVLCFLAIMGIVYVAFSQSSATVSDGGGGGGSSAQIAGNVFEAAGGASVSKSGNTVTYTAAGTSITNNFVTQVMQTNYVGGATNTIAAATLTGTIADARLSSAVVLTNGAQTISGAKTFTDAFKATSTTISEFSGARTDLKSTALLGLTEAYYDSAASSWSLHGGTATVPRNKWIAGGTDRVLLRMLGSAAYATNFVEWQDSAGNNLGWIGSDGRGFFPSLINDGALTQRGLATFTNSINMSNTSITNMLAGTVATDGVTVGQMMSTNGVPHTEFLKINTYAAYGSTDVSIPRFLNTVTNTFGAGTATYLTNAANGMKFTVLKAGLYSLSQSVNSSGTSTIFGWSVNASNPADLISNQTGGTGLGFCVNLVSHTSSMSVIVPCVSNDVIRMHWDGSVPVTAGNCSAIITRVGE